MAVTSRDIMGELDIKNVKTLTRWHQAGIIPEPQVDLHPDGIGRIASWPEWVLAHCRVIKRLTSEGQTLKQIKDTFGSDWTVIAYRYRKYRFADAYDKMQQDEERNVIREAIETEVAKGAGAIRSHLQTSNFAVVLDRAAKRAIKMVREGYNVVLIVTRKNLHVVPDVVVGQFLADHINVVEPFLVVPLYRLIAGNASVTSVPRSPTVCARSTVVRKTEADPIKEDINVLDDWTFSIESAGG